MNKYRCGQTFIAAYFFFTDKCNLNCIHCYRYHTKFYEEAPIKQLILIVDKIHQSAKRMGLTSYIILSGGEPLCSSNFYPLMDYLSHNFSSAEMAVGLLTNGTLVDETTAKRLREYPLLRYVQVSLDGAASVTHDEIRGKGSFKKAVKGIKSLREAGINVASNFTVHKMNYKDAFEIPFKAEKVGIDALSVCRIVPSKTTRDRSLSAKEVRRLYRRLAEIEKNFKIKRTRGESNFRIIVDRCDWPLIYPAETEATNYFHYNGNHCVAGHHISVLSNGTLYPCSRLPIPTGNILQENLENILECELVKRLINRRFHLKGKCRSCKFSKDPLHSQLCAGGAACLAYAYYEDPFMPDPTCCLRPEKE